MTRQRQSRWQVGLVLSCLLAGSLLGVARANLSAGNEHDRSADLSTLVREAEQRVAGAELRAGDLQSQIDESAAKDLSPQVATARSAADRLRPSAQFAAVTGPALTVTLADAARDSDGNYPLGVNPDDLVVHQQDVQSVVNALWAGGAEAMSIMGQRVITTSAVRCIGNTLMLQGRTYSPPFVVVAIGATDAMTAALAAEPGVSLFLQYVERYDLVFEVQVESAVTLPAYDSLIGMSAAQPGIG